MEHLEQWRIIFVDDHHHLFARLLVGAAYKAGENLTGSVLPRILAIDVIQGFKLCEQRISQFLHAIPSFRHTHIDVEHGITFPLLLQLHHLQTLEKFALASEERAQRGGEQRLSESPWTT